MSVCGNLTNLPTFTILPSIYTIHDIAHIEAQHIVSKNVIAA